jgi:hypothetical protein
VLVERLGALSSDRMRAALDVAVGGGGGGGGEGLLLLLGFGHP